MAKKKKGRRGRKGKKKQAAGGAESSDESAGEEAPASPSAPPPAPPSTPAAPSGPAPPSGSEDGPTSLTVNERRLIPLVLQERGGGFSPEALPYVNAKKLEELNGALLLSHASKAMIRSFNLMTPSFKRWQERVDRGEFNIAEMALSLEVAEYFIHYHGRVTKLLLRKMKHELESFPSDED